MLQNLLIKKKPRDFPSFFYFVPFFSINECLIVEIDQGILRENNKLRK